MYNVEAVPDHFIPKMNRTASTGFIIQKIGYQFKQYLDNNDNDFIKSHKYHCRCCKRECLYWGCSYFGKGIIGLNIITEEQTQINKYLDDWDNNKTHKPHKCKHCKRINCLVWHCKYYRKNVITLGGKYSKFPIRCVRCKICNVVFAVLPIFLIKYYKFTKYVISYTLNKIKKITYEETFEIIHCIFDINVTINTLQNWTINLKL